VKPKRLVLSNAHNTLLHKKNVFQVCENVVDVVIVAQFEVIGLCRWIFQYFFPTEVCRSAHCLVFVEIPLSWTEKAFLGAFLTLQHERRSKNLV